MGGKPSPHVMVLVSFYHPNHEDRDLQLFLSDTHSNNFFSHHHYLCIFSLHSRIQAIKIKKKYLLLLAPNLLHLLITYISSFSSCHLFILQLWWLRCKCWWSWIFITSDEENDFLSTIRILIIMIISHVIPDYQEWFREEMWRSWDEDSTHVKCKNQKTRKIFKLILLIISSFLVGILIRDTRKVYTADADIFSSLFWLRKFLKIPVSHDLMAFLLEDYPQIITCDTWVWRNEMKEK